MFPKPKKRKRSKRKALVTRLDTLVSQIVRAKTPFCVVCGKTDRLTAGHVFSRKNYSARWNFWNVHTQCLGCNLSHEYDPMPYYDWFKKEYGEEAFRELYHKWKQISKLSDIDLQELYDELKDGN